MLRNNKPDAGKTMTTDDLIHYSDAWNAHDIDTIMSFMSEDCVFETGGGTEKYGTRIKGYEAVRARFIEVWTEIPEVRFIDALHFVQGNHGCSEWTFVGNRTDGSAVEIDGCDIFTFAGNKITSKRSYIKHRVAQ
ncbi:DUF4440 domain-containing protein [Oceanicoccus sagamiensis]|uniref:DUF4440 domain-containing protein n=2 Tax=Oceanicoccus sagamiensis TaxID=716816 RepID=A0A1X9NFT5_9GAMM|nr:DUF4440 domain-containing protein [Oceanicoccus sagamiensis]